LKQLQLIQILSIKGFAAAVPGLSAQAARRINLISGASNGPVAAESRRRTSETPAACGFFCLPRVNAVFAGHPKGQGLAVPDLHASWRKNREVRMKSAVWGFAAPGMVPGLIAAPAVTQDQAKINPTDPQPTCPMCPGAYIPLTELQAYAQKALAEKLLDQQVRDVDIGKARLGIGMVHRGKLDQPAPDSVAEHDQISEVYHVISGAATLVLGPDIVNRQRRPATMRTVREFNGPGNNGSDIKGGVAHQIKAGDVVVIPAGTGHWFTKIDDHIDYLMVRIDPDKVTPLKSGEQSKEYLSKPAQKGE